MNCAVAVFGEPGGFPSHDVDCHNRKLHLLRSPNTDPHHCRPPHIRPRAYKPGSPLVEPHRWLGCGAVGGHHHRPLQLASAIPLDTPVPELHPHCCGRSLPASCLILAPQRSQLVQEPSA